LYIVIDHVEHVFYHLQDLQLHFDPCEEFLPWGPYSCRRVKFVPVRCTRSMWFFLPRSLHWSCKLWTKSEDVPFRTDILSTTCSLNTINVWSCRTCFTCSKFLADRRDSKAFACFGIHFLPSRISILSCI
jgi:hypothetical protein